MKKVISTLLAGAMLAGMSVSAFADTAIADPVENGAYDGDGASLVGASDGVGSVTWAGSGLPKDTATAAALPTELVLDGAVPSGTIYIPLAGGSDALISIGNSKAVQAKVLTDEDYFKLKIDKKDGSKYVKKISVVTDKKLISGKTRSEFLKIELNDSMTTSELKSNGAITFTAKAAASSYNNTSKEIDSANDYESGDFVKINYTFWINNKKVEGSDGTADTGERVYFKPTSNEDNTMIWGDDRAALFFEGNDDTSKFYARLSTKSDSDIYNEYGDPVNADLWFYDFVGSATIPSTSRATVTLGIPWDEDDEYTPNPEDCFIYEKDADGNLTDVTDKFVYSEDNEGTTGIEGWSMKTRTLGTYILSDTELDTTASDVEEPSSSEESSSTVNGGKDIPSTGSSDMVGIAVIAATVSLAAAGAVAFKKASK